MTSNLAFNISVLNWKSKGSAYDTKILTGEILLQNTGDETVTFVYTRLSGSYFCVLLSKEDCFFPTIKPRRFVSLPFTLSVLRPNIQLRIEANYSTESGEQRSQIKRIENKNIYTCQENEHTVFISYCTRDLEYIAPIVKVIKMEGFKVWIAEFDMRIDDFFPDPIKKAISEADRFIVFLSKNSINSPWVADELSLAKKRMASDPSFTIIPVQIDKDIDTAFLKPLDILFLDVEGFANASSITQRLRIGKSSTSSKKVV